MMKNTKHYTQVRYNALIVYAALSQRRLERADIAERLMLQRAHAELQRDSKKVTRINKTLNAMRKAHPVRRK